jgi:hypothetical protein
MMWMVNLYDKTGFLFAYKSFTKQEDAEKYSLNLGKGRARIQRLET